MSAKNIVAKASVMISCITGGGVTNENFAVKTFTGELKSI